MIITDGIFNQGVSIDHSAVYCGINSQCPTIHIKLRILCFLVRRKLNCAQEMRMPFEWFVHRHHVVRFVSFARFFLQISVN